MVVTDVMLQVTGFVMEWVRTQSSYDTIVAKTMPADWASKHLPVLSHGTIHHLYKGFNVLEPNGQAIQCHRGCGVENRKWEIKATTVKIECRGCDSICHVAKQDLDTSTLLGSRGLIRVNYPIGQASTTWISKGNTHPDTSTVASRKRPNQPTLLIPEVVGTPPASPSPSPSSSQSALMEPLTTRVPPGSTNHHSTACRLPPQSSHVQHPLLEVEPIVRSQFAPDNVTHEAGHDSLTHHSRPIFSLDDIPTLHVSTHSRKRRRRN